MFARSSWILAGLVALAAILRLLGLSSREIHPDEWYHVLAGASWAQGEGLTFVRGIYDRAWPYTISTGLAANWLGLEGFVAARFPAFLSGILCIWLIYVLGKRTASATVGLIAAALLTFDHMAIEWSQLSRFYTMQTACILGLACLVVGPSFGAPLASLKRTAAAGLCALGLAMLALSLQVISILAIAGLGAFLFTRTPFFTVEFARTPSRARTLIGLLIIAAVVLGIAGTAVMWPELRATQAWTAEHRDDFFYYDDYLRAMYGVLWPLTPVAVLIGLVYARNAVLMALSVVIPVLLFQSVGGMKAPRYIIQATPFLILLWAVGLHFGFMWLAALLRDRLTLFSPKLQNVTATVMTLGVLAIALAGNLSYRETAKWTLRDGRATIAGKPLLDGNPVDPARDASLREIAPKLRGEALLFASEPAILAFYGPRANFNLINPRNDDGVPANYEAKTGQVNLGSAAELELALDCTESADIVILEEKVGTFHLPDDTLAVLEERGVRASLENSAFRLYRWDRREDQSGTDCSVIETELAKQAT